MQAPGPLARVLELEAQGTDAVAYMRALRTLAASIRTDAQLQAALATWLLDALGLGDGPGEAPAPAVEARWDAAVDVVADGESLAAFLEKVAARLEGGKVPARLNLLSLLRTKVVWRARDRLRRRNARAAREGHDATGRAQSVEHQARIVAGLVLARVGERFGDDPARVDVLERLLQGETVTEVAKACDVSRPTIYRWLGAIRSWIAEGGS